MQCPYCYSLATQRLEVVYQQSSSLFAKRAAPPRKGPIGWPIFFLLVGLAILFGEDTSMLLRFIAAVFTLLAGMVVFARICANGKTYDNAYENWKNQWICHQCGQIFSQEPPPANNGFAVLAEQEHSILKARQRHLRKLKKKAKH